MTRRNEDAVAGETPERSAWALDIMRKSMDAAIAPTDEMDLGDWIARKADDSTDATSAIPFDPSAPEQ